MNPAIKKEKWTPEEDAQVSNPASSSSIRARDLGVISSRVGFLAPEAASAPRATESFFYDEDAPFESSLRSAVVATSRFFEDDDRDGGASKRRYMHLVVVFVPVFFFSS